MAGVRLGRWPRVALIALATLIGAVALAVPATTHAAGGFFGLAPAPGAGDFRTADGDQEISELVTALEAAGCDVLSLAFFNAPAERFDFHFPGIEAISDLSATDPVANGKVFFAACDVADADDVADVDEVRLRAFRYTIRAESVGTIGTILIEQVGEVVLPDREHFRLRMDLGGELFDTEVITIGDSEWQRGDVPAPNFGLSLASFFDGEGGFNFDVDGEGGVFDPAAVGALETTEERVNGVDTIRYELDGEQFATLITAFVPVAGEQLPLLSLWVSRDLGVPVRMVIESAVAGERGSFRFEINLTDLNAPSISVEPPA